VFENLAAFFFALVGRFVVDELARGGMTMMVMGNLVGGSHDSVASRQHATVKTATPPEVPQRSGNLSF